jgi:hypothetical protein
MRLDHVRRLALAALGDVLTDDRTSAVRLADYEAALQEIARVCDTAPKPDPLLARMRAALREEGR